MDSTSGATHALVGGAGGDADPPGCCPGVVAGAALWWRLAWEGGTPLSCLSSFILGEDEMKWKEASVELEVRSTPESVKGAGGGAGPPGWCPGVVAGAVLWWRLAWEGGTPLSCPSSFILGEDEMKWNEASVELEVRSTPESVEGAGGGAALWEGGAPLSCLLSLLVDERIDLVIGSRR